MLSVFNVVVSLALLQGIACQLCPTIPGQNWLDVMFLIDTSNGMTASGLKSVKVFMDSILQNVNLGNGPNQMRAGIIEYDETARITVHLGSLTRNYNLDYPSSNNDGTNLDDAIQKSTGEFDQYASPGRAQRQALIIIASDYQKRNSYKDPVQGSKQFQHDRGPVLVYDFFQVSGSPNPTLSQVASTGFFYVNENSTDLKKTGLGHANCFCESGSNSFSNVLDGSPTAGCYTAEVMTLNRDQAIITCTGDGGSLPMITDRRQSFFISTLFPKSKMKIWVGLKYDYDYNTGFGRGAYLWPNGLPLGANDYQPWAAPQNPKSPYGQECVYFQQIDLNTFYWYNEACDTELMYVCVTAPCSESRFCSS